MPPGAARPNYDIWWMDVDTGKKVRITFAPGQDVLPVLNADGTKLLWTSTRDGRQPAQLYIARISSHRRTNKRVCGVWSDAPAPSGLCFQVSVVWLFVVRDGTPVPLRSGSPGRTNLARGRAVTMQIYQ